MKAVTVKWQLFLYVKIHKIFLKSKRHFVENFLFWKTFYVDKFLKSHIFNNLTFSFGQLFKIVDKFSCQKICTIEKKAVPLQHFSRFMKFIEKHI